jgi:ribosomal-protein-alanine N-acetyltransferase
MNEQFSYSDGITTKRLVTRFLTTADVEPWKEFLTDKEAMRYINTQGVTDVNQLAKNWIDKQLWRYSVNKMGFQAILRKDTKELVGICGLLVQDVNEEEMIEIGYHFLRRYWGNCYATEAAIAFKNYAFENNITDKVISLINIHNVPSQKVATRNGMKREKQIWWFDQDIYVYGVKK